MKPIDFRNATFASLAEHIDGKRATVFGAWGTHGPCTTAELAARSGLSILTLRPRTTELVQLGFVRLHETQRAQGEGVYRVATPEEFATWLEGKRAESGPAQRELALADCAKR